jgi:prolyl 4-hydroxylase
MSSPVPTSSDTPNSPSNGTASSSSSFLASSTKCPSFHAFHVLGAILSFLLGIFTPALFEQTNLQSLLQLQDVFQLFIKHPLPPHTTTNTQKQPIKHVSCSSDTLKHFLHDAPIQGLHILCFDDLDDDVILQMYYQAYHPITLNTDDVSHHYSNNDKDRLWNYFVKKEVVSHHLKVQNHIVSNTQPWAFFSTTGMRIAGELDDSKISSAQLIYTWDILRKHGMVVLYEGGNWMWPGVRIGYTRFVEVNALESSNNQGQMDTMSSSTKTMELETLSIQPLVVSVKNFITMDECDHIQNMAQPYMEYSTVTLMDQDKGRPASEFRTSQSTFLGADDNDVIMKALEDRTASLTRIPKSHQEFTQVLRYGLGERYLAHLDWFDKRMYQNDKDTLQMIQHGKRNRLATVFWYLSDVQQGGETSFPRFNNAPHPHNPVSSNAWCDNANLKVTPEKGKVIIFYSLLADGRGDPLSLHGACPVEKGIKWAANKWVWNAPMDFLIG